jgi:hypothetical protein
MTKTLDNNAIWNEAAKGGLLLGGVSVGCLTLKELAAVSGSNFLVTAAAVILWVVEFFGCILLMREQLLKLKARYENVQMADTAKLGRRIALFSGLLLASAQALFIMQMPSEEMNEMVSQLSESLSLTAADMENVNGVLDRLPLFTFVFQWAYCYLYGAVLASILSRYIFMKELFNQ